MSELIVFNSVDYCILGIPAYLFCACIATVIAICLYIVLLSSKRYPIDPYLKCLLYACAGLVVCARGFGCLSGIFGAVGRSEAITWDVIKNTGIVFYGGLIGLLLTFQFALTRVRGNLRFQSLDILAVTIPIFHSISRIGCFLGGCCYGIACTTPLSISYTVELMGQLDTNQRIPVQLVESVLNFLLFLYLFNLFRRKDWETQHILQKYLILYSFLRFILEFFRGDTNRGIMFGISFSQIISILIWVILAAKYRKLITEADVHERNNRNLY